MTKYSIICTSVTTAVSSVLSLTTSVTALSFYSVHVADVDDGSV